MPYRTVGYLVYVLGLAGLFAIAGLVLIGADLRASARTGPRWKRRLVGAGLLLLGTVGITYGLTRRRPVVPVVMCYEAALPATRPAATNTVRAAAGRLHRQLMLLESCVNAEELRREVIDKTIQAIEADVGLLGDAQALATLTEAEQDEVRALREMIRRHVAEIRARLDAPAPTTAPR